jgi:hypothetical protein
MKINFYKSQNFYTRIKNELYGKLVETFHNVSECKTVIYFDWWFPLQFTQPGDIDR